MPRTRRHPSRRGDVREANYERKIKAAYPIHPEIFERLYQDWSGLVKFQRTRGVSAVLGANGVEKTIELKLTADELGQLKKSADHVLENVKRLIL